MPGRKEPGADSEIARLWFALGRTNVEPLTPQVLTDAQTTVDFFAGLGLIKSYRAASLFDSSFSAALQPATAQALP